MKETLLFLYTTNVMPFFRSHDSLSRWGKFTCISFGIALIHHATILSSARHHAILSSYV